MGNFKEQLDEFARIFENKGYDGIIDCAGFMCNSVQRAIICYSGKLISWKEGMELPKASFLTGRMREVWKDGALSYIFLNFDFRHSVKHGFAVTKVTARQITGGGDLLRIKTWMIKSPDDIPKKEQAIAGVVSKPLKKQRLKNRM